MKKTLAVLMMVLLLAMLIVSCEADSPVIIHKVTFNSGNGNEAKVESVIDGEKTVKPSDPEKTGYTFLGWYDGDTLFDFETSVKQDYSLTAKWQIQTFTVSFDANGGKGSYGSQIIDYGGKVDTTKVKDPTKAEYKFLGWYDGESKVDLATLIVTKDYELKAKWNINSYTVTFDSDGGTSYDPQSVEYNNTTTSPGTPEKDGCTFMGWYNGSEKFDFDKSITENITLKAKWGYTVTFNSNGGSEVGSVVVEQNGTVTKPAANPTKEGQVFVGWYDSSNKEFDFNTKIDKKTDLTAHWRNPYIVTFDVDGNTKTIPSKQDNGDGKVEAPTDKPTKAGWVFDHWSTEKNGTTPFDFNSVLTGDITLYAVFRDYYIVGDIGPAGGTIIYDCDADNNDGKNDGAGEDNLKSSDCGWRYLEAAPTDAGTYTWGPNLSLGTGSEKGDGWKNMVKFMDEVGGLANFPAAEACDKYSVTVGGVTYDDWFLPSLDELKLIIDNGLINGQYFSSSEYDVSKAWYRQRLDYGGWDSSFCSKSSSKSVRPVRAFLTWDKTNPPTLTNLTPQYTVTFELNGGTGTVDTQTVKKGRTATKPATNPKKDGCIFDKWTKADGTEYNFGDAVSGNITLCAKWITPAVGVTVNLGTVSWKVLDVDTTNKRALLFSVNVLELCSFDYDTIRSYLNNRETEDGFIKKYGLENVDMCSVDVSGDKTTVDNTKSDKLFLFSRVDAGYPSETSSLGTATYNGRNYSWWLRTTNVYTGNILHVSIVNENGYISECNLSTDNSQKGLRPAFWIDLNVSK